MKINSILIVKNNTNLFANIKLILHQIFQNRQNHNLHLTPQRENLATYVKFVFQVPTFNILE